MEYLLNTPRGSASTEQLIILAKGFTRIFWGIPIALLLFIGAISINFIPFLRLPSYIFGILLVYWGVVLLYRAGIITEKWNTLVKGCLIAVFAQIYLAPFIYWWKQLPHHTYFTIHMFALVFAMTFTMLLIARIAGQLAESINDEWFRIESRICGWVVILLIFAPMIIYLTYSLQASLRHHTSLYLEISQVHYGMPDYIQGLLLLPFTLTMAIVWKAKERCCQCLRYQLRRDEEQNFRVQPGAS